MLSENKFSLGCIILHLTRYKRLRNGVGREPTTYHLHAIYLEL